jgi:hypothetical protein
MMNRLANLFIFANYPNEFWKIGVLYDSVYNVANFITAVILFQKFFINMINRFFRCAQVHLNSSLKNIQLLSIRVRSEIYQRVGLHIFPFLISPAFQGNQLAISNINT